MKKSIYLFLNIIGVLSVLSGVYLAFTGAAFGQYFPGIFIGIVLIGVIYFDNKREQTDD